MRCPYCQQPVAVDAAECAACRLTFPRACALLGAALRLTPLVADTTRTLDLADHHRLKRRLRKIEERFPQLVPQVVVHHFPAEHPFSTHVFWLFNTANLAGDSRRGRDNHSLMIVLDPSRGEAAVIPGYGLEVFLTDVPSKEFWLSMRKSFFKSALRGFLGASFWWLLSGGGFG